MAITEQIEQIAGLQKRLNEDLAKIRSQFAFVNQETPFGQVRFEGSPEEGFTRITELSPEQQALADQQRQFSQQQLSLAADALSRGQNAFSQGPVDLSNLPDRPTLSGTENAAQSVADAIYEQEGGRLRNEFDREREALIQRLVASGNPRGSPRFQEALRQFEQRQADSFQDLARRSRIAAGQEQNRLFNLGTTARENQLNERLTLRALPQQEAVQQAALALRGGVQSQSPQFGQTPRVRVGGVDVTGPFTSLKGQENQAAIAAANNEAAAARLGQRFEQQKALSEQGFQQDLALAALQGDEIESPGAFDQILTGVAPGVGAGVGKAIGSAFG